MTALAALLADPRATLRALDCLEARDSFLTFCGMVEIPAAPVEDDPDDELGEPRYRPPNRPTAAHHVELCGVLQAVAEGRVDRAMFFLPPGAAKSTYGSVLFAPWFMARKPNLNVIVATYGSDLARKIGRCGRSVVNQPVFRDIFGVGLEPGLKAADEWALENGSEFMGGGILSGITGNRADLIIIDDPIKGRQDAESPTIRERTLAEYQDSLRSRLKARGRILLIQTRWHEEDLAGAILPEDYDGQSGWVACRDGRWWYVVCIPAMAERDDDPLGRKPGEMLWPEYWPPEHWIEPRQVARTWASLYQQRPRPAEGTFFQKDWFKRYVPDQLPKHLNRYITSDHAPGGGEDHDFSCVRVWGVDGDGDLWLLDGFRHQATMDVTADLALGLIRRHKPFAWFPEDDNNWKTAAGFVARTMREAIPPVHCRIEPMSPHGSDKAAKAQAFQAMAASGRVWLPVGPQGDDVLDQYLKFPMGKNDDEVDAAGVIGRAIDMAHPAIVPTERPPEVRVRYAKKPKKSGWAT